MVNSTAKTLVIYKIKKQKNTNTVKLDGWYPETTKGIREITDQIIAEKELDIEPNDITIVKVQLLGQLGRD